MQLQGIASDSTADPATTSSKTGRFSSSPDHGPVIGNRQPCGSAS
jgi:hypothetical protein